MKIKYFIVPFGSDNGDACFQAIVSQQHVSDKDIKVLRPNDMSQIFMVPYFQDYQGLALLVRSDNILNQNIDVSSFITDQNTMIFNTEKTIFVINCGSPLLQNAFSPRVITSVDLNQFMSFHNLGNASDWITDSSLCNYFNCNVHHEIINNNEIIHTSTNQEDEIIDLAFDDIIELSYDRDTDVFEG